jgi:AraC-like DNA-binding protein
LFGAPLPCRQIDCRVARVIQNVIAQPGERHSAEECARSVGLSVSRFLHLFKQEVGVPFRPFRAWKRARSLLDLVSRSGSLTDMALDSGYTDSSHFSNSVRNTYGVKASEMVASARRLTLRRGGVSHNAGMTRH